MSIMIKGMRMPTSCYDCNCFIRDSDGSDYCCLLMLDIEGNDKRDDDCPLVPVPPHGRLIDADAYAQEIRERHESASEWYKKATDDEILARAESAMITFTECFLTLKKMSTVIPAEESE